MMGEDPVNVVATHGQLELLLIEDSASDVRLTREVFRDVNSAVHVSVVADGLEAMAFLRCDGIVDAPRPDLILLDIKLGAMDGLAALAAIKDDEDLRTIPIIVLSASDAEEDVARSYQLHANCYLHKPALLDDFEGMIRSINDFWLTKAASRKRPR
jgi:two-component system, chemotaxis family, response regulator Rcp1